METIAREDISFVSTVVEFVQPSYLGSIVYLILQSQLNATMQHSFDRREKISSVAPASTHCMGLCNYYMHNISIEAKHYI